MRMNLIEAERLICAYFGCKYMALFGLSARERIQMGLMIKYPEMYSHYPDVYSTSTSVPLTMMLAF